MGGRTKKTGGAGRAFVPVAGGVLVPVAGGVLVPVAQRPEERKKSEE